MVATVSRRQVLAGAAGSLAILAGCQGETGRDGATDHWPLARRDPGRTGYNPHADGPTLGRERWRVDTDEAASTPVVAGEFVYVGGDAVFAFALADGAAQWERSLHFNTQSAPAVVDDTVYVTSKFAYYSIDGATGRDRWFDNEGAVRFHAPVAADGTLFQAATAVGDPEFTAAVVARSTDDGSERWRTEVGGGVLPPFAPAIADGRVYAGRDAIYTLDARTGDRLWRFEGPEITAFGDPVVVGDRVYVPGTRPTPGPGPPGGVVLALDAATGEEHWRFETGLPAPSPAVTDERVIVTSDAVYALTTAGGAVDWRVDSNRFVTASPSVTRSRVYLAGVAGTIQALSIEDGETVWRLPTAAPRLSAPAVIDSLVLVGGADGRVLALGEDA